MNSHIFGFDEITEYNTKTRIILLSIIANCCLQVVTALFIKEPLATILFVPLWASALLLFGIQMYRVFSCRPSALSNRTRRLIDKIFDVDSIVKSKADAIWHRVGKGYIDFELKFKTFTDQILDIQIIADLKKSSSTYKLSIDLDDDVLPIQREVDNRVFVPLLEQELKQHMDRILASMKELQKRKEQEEQEELEYELE
jgi:hypothetical protein